MKEVAPEKRGNFWEFLGFFVFNYKNHKNHGMFGIFRVVFFVASPVKRTIWDHRGPWWGIHKQNRWGDEPLGEDTSSSDGESNSAMDFTEAGTQGADGTPWKINGWDSNHHYKTMGGCSYNHHCWTLEGFF